MATKRPVLTDESFLRHLFSPKKNPLPVGIRTRALVSAKGRSKSRVASYNRMSGKNQELLRRSGMREAYLKGEASLTDARKSLRATAVQRGIAKPLRGQSAAQRETRRRSLDAFVASKIIQGLRGEGRQPKVATVVRNVPYIPDDVYDRMHLMSGRDIIEYATDDDNLVTVGGQRFNPLWYH